MRNLTKALVGCLALLPSASLLWAEADPRVTARLEKLLPEHEVDSVRETPISGLYEVMMGTQVVYVSGDGRYMLQGRLMDLENREDLTEQRQAAARKKALEAISEDKMIIFAPEEYEHTLTVFTDISCGYCRKLHREIDDYGDAGIRVRYVFFPRAGKGSDSYKQSVSVWCSDDQQQAMTDAKAGKRPEEKTCENPVDEHMALGREIGISGTPALMLETGQMIAGYVPIDRLSQIVNDE